MSAIAPTWPCGHARTVANTASIGKAGKRCRTCRQRIGREHARRKQGYYEADLSRLPPCEFCRAPMVQTAHDTFECGEACPPSQGAVPEWEWTASAKLRWAVKMQRERGGNAKAKAIVVGGVE